MTDLSQPDIPYQQDTYRSTVDFDYPPSAALTQSLTSLLRHSRTTMADGDDFSRPSSRLSESWDDIRSDVSPEDDLQSEKSTAASLIRRNETGELESLDGKQDTSSQVAEDESTEDPAASQELPPLVEPVSEAGHDSSMTSRPSSSQIINFEEPGLSPNTEQVDVKHTIHVFDDNESAAIMRSIGQSIHDGQLFGTIRMTMSNQGLDLDRPFRVVYVGQPEQRVHVLAKFGDALMAGKEPGFNPSTMDESRYHVIPTSFDPNGPTELVPIQTQIVVDECISAASVRSDNVVEQIFLRFKRGKDVLFKSTWSDGQFDLSPATSWTPPDVAIMFFSTEDSNVMKERLRLAHEYMKRHDVPVMMVSEEPIWGSTARFPEVDEHSLHFCVETRPAQGFETSVLQRLPIDLETFENIDSAQLSRHLASLQCNAAQGTQQIAEQEDSSCSTLLTIPKYIKDVEKNLSKSFYQKEMHIHSFFQQRALQVSAALILTLLTSALAYSFYCFAVPISATAPFVPPIQSLPLQVPATTTTTVSTSTIYLTSVQSSVIKTDIVAPKVETSLSMIHTDLSVPRIKVDQAVEKLNVSDGFHVRVLGCCHMIIKPPKKMVKKKKNHPNFAVTIMRGDEVVPFEFNKLFDGVYAAFLLPDDSYGRIKVIINTTKPEKEEVFDLDFGNPWFKMASWKKSARRLVYRAQENLAAVESGILGTFDKYAGDEIMEERLRQAAKQLAILQKRAQRTIKKTTDLVQARSKEFRTASTGHGQVWSDQLRQRTDSAVKDLTVYTQSATIIGRRIAQDLMQSASSQVSALQEAMSPRKMIPESAKKPLYLAQKRARALFGLSTPNRMEAKDDKRETGDKRRTCSAKFGTKGKGKDRMR